MRRPTFWLGLAVVLSLVVAGSVDRSATTDASEVGARSEPGDAGAAGSITRFLDRRLPAGASGTLVAVRGGRIVLCRGFGWADREHHIRAGCDSVYDVMSMTKQFTAAAILKLQMMGKLRVTDRIGQHLGPIPRDKREITVKQLLTHTSGLVDSLGGDYERLNRREMIAAAMSSTLQSDPGARYRYSNLGYSLLAAIIQQVSGMSYERFLVRHLFRPAGMTQTGYVLPHWRHGRVAVEYGPRGASHGRPFDHPWAPNGPYWNLRGNGGLLSSARDVAHWHFALQHHTVLDRRTTRQLFRSRVKEEPGGDSFYGYGWVLQKTPIGRVAWHNGGNGWSYGELTRVLRAPGAMIFWITNRNRNVRAGWSMERLRPSITEGVARRLVGN